MDIRFFNCTILTMKDKDNGELISPFKGEVWVCGNRIHKVINLEDNSSSNIDIIDESRDEPQSPSDKIHFDREIDLKGNLVMPGFKDAHTHSPMTFLRSMADDLPLREWLNNVIFPMEKKLVPDDVYYFTKIAVMEYLSSGITSVFDMYFYQNYVAKAFIDCGIRGVLCSPLNDFTENPEIMAKNYEYYNNSNPLISYKLGFHAQYTTSNELLKEVAHYANHYKTGVFCHNSETKSEVESCILANGVTPTKHMDNMGLFNYGGGGFHCNYLSDEDVRIYKDHGLSVISNPASNAKLASGIAPLKHYIESGIATENIALGTDGPASNNALDMFREMYLAAVLAKLKCEDACTIDATTILKMATLGGAKTMGLDNCMYVLPGQLADLIVLDISKPNMQPNNNLTKSIVYCGGKHNVVLTMIDGKILYENGTYHIDDTPEYIYMKANESMKHIIQ